MLVLGQLVPVSAQLLFFDGSEQTIDQYPAVVGTTVSDTQTVWLGGIETTRELSFMAETSFTSQGISTSIGENYFTYSQGPGIDSIATVIWGGTEDMNLDLTAYGNRFDFGHVYSDLNGTKVKISIWNETTEYSYEWIVDRWEGPETQWYSLSFAAFAGADMTDVDKIMLQVDSPSMNDSTFVGFQVVPEPSGALLIGVAGLTCILRRRKFNH